MNAKGREPHAKLAGARKPPHEHPSIPENRMRTGQGAHLQLRKISHIKPPHKKDKCLKAFAFPNDFFNSLTK
ncbi:hypothetical protein Q73_10975 [Bacillus coahuilensis m2-6]|nr:hypothetical protein Q73_10975 [Bacillus coahuilensis m2-6]